MFTGAVTVSYEGYVCLINLVITFIVGIRLCVALVVNNLYKFGCRRVRLTALVWSVWALIVFCLVRVDVVRMNAVLWLAVAVMIVGFVDLRVLFVVCCFDFVDCVWCLMDLFCNVSMFMGFDCYCTDCEWCCDVTFRFTYIMDFTLVIVKRNYWLSLLQLS
eukprot:gene13154-9000_t